MTIYGLRTTDGRVALRRWLWRVIHQLGRDSRYVCASLPLAVVGCAVVLGGLGSGVALLPTLLGLPILAGMISVTRGFTALERRRLGWVLTPEPVRPIYRQPVHDAGVWRRILTRLTDLQSWLEVLHRIVMLPVAVLTFLPLAFWWLEGVGNVLRITYDWVIASPGNEDVHDLLGLPDTFVVRVLFFTSIGLVFLLTLPLVARCCALVQAHVTRVMLFSLAGTREQIAELERDKAAAETGLDTARAQTAAAVSAEAIALRRLERDIHDGPQQRLIRLAMDLGRAKRQVDADPTAAKIAMSQAISQTRETLDELRALSRGIAPPILADRGLTAALATLASRCPVPVRLETPGSERLAAGAEAVAYFVVAETLTNVAKHSQATECLIALRREPTSILIEVTDDGIGGAHVAKGHGLSGLSDRVTAAGGRFRVDSPAGSGTRILVELPL